MSYEVSSKLRVWGREGIEPGTINQAMKAANLSIVQPYLALMPDAHVGIGSTVGSVIPTQGAIIPAAVGVDIGCGMAAVKTSLSLSDLPDDLTPLLGLIERAVPAGVGQGHTNSSSVADRWLSSNISWTQLDTKQSLTAARQFGTLGSGNHFYEVSSDEEDNVWVVLHSGSRGIGNQLARIHIEKAKGLMGQLEEKLEDPDLAYFLEGTSEFQAYLADLLWAQQYARANRDQMMNASLHTFFDFVGQGRELERINCHHNYTAQEEYDGQSVWVTRKGAIRAGEGDLGIIPGSMGTDTYIVKGLGNSESFNSCSHGAGRKLSRSAAKREYSDVDLTLLMEGKTWNSDHASALVDEIPEAYKDIREVMAAQADLVRVVARLEQVFNYKGYSDKGKNDHK